MSDLIKQLRDEPTAHEQRNGLTVPAMQVWHETACKAADEIEAKDKRIEQLEAENERLRERATVSQRNETTYRREYERLRAALEWIATKPPPDDAYELRMLARKALAAVEGKVVDAGCDNQ